MTGWIFMKCGTGIMPLAHHLNSYIIFLQSVTATITGCKVHEMGDVVIAYHSFCMCDDVTAHNDATLHGMCHKNTF
jgi:hypothetical protein